MQKLNLPLSKGKVNLRRLLQKLKDVHFFLTSSFFDSRQTKVLFSRDTDSLDNLMVLLLEN